MRICWAALSGVLIAAATGVAFADDDDVTMNEVPDAVRETIENEAQGGVVEDIERKWRNGRTIYEVEIERNDQELELHIDENGKVIRRERND